MRSMLLRLTPAALLLGCATGGAACFLYPAAFPCAGDENCPGALVCVQERCVPQGERPPGGEGVGDVDPDGDAPAQDGDGPQPNPDDGTEGPGDGDPGEVDPCTEPTEVAGDVVLSSNEEVLDFANAHGGEGGCVRILGDLSISGTEVTSLAPLSVLLEVGGDLVVIDAPALDGLQGLDGLVSVGGDLLVEGCDDLEDLFPLVGLTDVGGGLTIQGNAQMERIGLPSLERIGDEGPLVVRDNPDLPACEAELLRARLEEGGYEGPATLTGNTGEDPCG